MTPEQRKKANSSLSQKMADLTEKQRDLNAQINRLDPEFHRLEKIIIEATTHRGRTTAEQFREGGIISRNAKEKYTPLAEKRRKLVMKRALVTKQLNGIKLRLDDLSRPSL
jgi:chromosome segregation ATPase